MDLDNEERPGFEIIDELDTGIRRVAAPRVPVRALVAGLVVATMLLAAPTLLVGRPGTTPGVRNGVIAWAIDGDIVAGDAATGLARPLVDDPGIDRNPLFSRDGAQLAFFRQVADDRALFDLFVSGADGRGAVLVSAVPMAMPEAVMWSPDGDSLLVDEPDGRHSR